MQDSYIDMCACSYKSVVDTVLDETLDSDPVTISEIHCTQFPSAAILFVAAACPYHCLHACEYVQILNT